MTEQLVTDPRCDCGQFTLTLLNFVLYDRDYRQDFPFAPQELHTEEMCSGVNLEEL